MNNINLKVTTEENSQNSFCCNNFAEMIVDVGLSNGLHHNSCLLLVSKEDLQDKLVFSINFVDHKKAICLKKIFIEKKSGRMSAIYYK